MINGIISYFSAATTACSGTSFLGFPKWYAYLPLNPDCSPSISNINDIWLIVAAVVEILLRVAALAAIVFVLYGGIQYITSQGEPDKAQHARSTVLNALIGLAIAVVAAAVVTFLAGQFKAAT